MGLDAALLVMGFEKAFSLELEDEELEQLLTPQMAIALIAQKLNADRTIRSHICPTQQAFHRIRRVFQEVLEVPRWRVQPSSRIQYLLPKYDRQTIWVEIRDLIGLEELPQRMGCLYCSNEPVTIQELVDWAVANSPRQFLLPDEPWTFPQVRSVVRAVVRYETGFHDFSDDDQWMFFG
jgi:hypothetical protein